MNLANWLKLITLASLSSANIVELFDTSFLDSIQSDTWFVGYFIDWSPHSRAIARFWEELSTELTQWSKDNSFNFASLNCEKNEELCKRHNIYGYPTFKIYKNGKFIEEYNGYPDINKLENYAKERAQRLEAIPETKHVAQAQAELVNDNAVVQEGAVQVEEPEVVPNPEGKTIEFTAENFKELVATGPWFVKFYAPWNGPSRALALFWEKLGEELKGQINVGSLNCDEADKNQLCMDYKIQGYPSLLFIRDGSSKEYDDSRNLEHLKAAAIKALAPPKTLNYDEIISKAFNNELFFIYYSLDDSFLKANPQTRSAIFNLNIRAPVYFTSEFRITGLNDDYTKPALFLIKNNKKETFSGDLTKIEQVSEWIKNNQYPLVRDISRDSMEETFINDDKNALMLIYDSKSDKQKKDVKNFEAIAQNLIKHNPGQFGEFIFTKYDSTGMEDQLEDQLGVHTSVLPIVLYYQYNQSIFYDVDPENKYIPVNEKAIVQFVSEADNGQLAINTESFDNDTKLLIESFYHEWAPFLYNYSCYTIGVPVAFIGLIVLVIFKFNSYSRYQSVETEKQ